GAQNVRGLDPLEVQFLVHHGGEPDVSLGSYRVDDALEQVAFEALGRVDFADLLTLDVRHRVDLGILLRAQGQVVVALRDGGGVSDRTHRARLGDGCGQAGG